MHDRCVALFGRRDQPTDAVEEYCRYLSSALTAHGIQLELLRVRWPELGWRKALHELAEKSQTPRNTWFLLQYTALAWSQRGFPWRVLNVIRTLKKNGARCTVVFHDSGPYPGNRAMDRIRRTAQLYTMRKATQLADLTVITVPRENLTWVPEDSRSVVFIPVGANLPQPEEVWSRKDQLKSEIPTVGVFSITLTNVPFGGPAVQRITAAMRYASARLGPLKLAVLGRNSEAAGRFLQEKLAGSAVEVLIHGVLDAEDVVRILGACDVQLFVGGAISSQRSSAISGIACGLPLVAARGWETASPITDAGVVLLSADSDDEFGPALVQVLSDDAFRASLRERSRRAYQQHFAWTAIAAEYAAALQKAGEN